VKGQRQRIRPSPAGVPRCLRIVNWMILHGRSARATQLKWGSRALGYTAANKSTDSS
jgi:hypothetical protein